MIPKGKNRRYMAGLFLTCSVVVTQAAAAYPSLALGVQRCHEKGFGQFSGKLQLLLLRRDFREGEPDGDANSGSIGLTLDYLSPEVHGATAGLQFIDVEKLIDSGSRDHSAGEAWLNSNSDYTTLNEVFVNLDLEPVGLPGTSLKVGRQILKLDFAPSYAIRQKAQAYEAAVLTREQQDGLSIALGHIERFSSWSSRDGRMDTMAATVDFVDVEDTAGVDYGTRGIEFASVTWRGFPSTTITLYDFYAHDLYNTLGLKLSHTIAAGEETAVALKCHYLGQTDVGRMDRDGAGEVRSNMLEVAVQLKAGRLTIEPGYTTISGDAAENNVRVPFRTSFTIDPELLWYTRQFDAGSDSFHLKGTYSIGSTSFYALYVMTCHEDNTGGGATDQEINGVVKHNFGASFYAAAKIGYGVQDNRDGRDSNANDSRLFLGYTF